LEALCHVALRFGGQLARGRDAALQFLPHLPQLLRHRLDEMVELRGQVLALGSEGILHLLPDRGKLGLRAPAGGPGNRAYHSSRQKPNAQPYSGIHQTASLITSSEKKNS
jgi:hypothetical protein